MASSAVAKAKLDAEVCDAAKTFIELYTNTIDMRRECVNVLYTESEPQLLWNGNPKCGSAEIQAFWNAFPKTSHELTILDAHNLETGGGKAIVLQAMGNVSIAGVTRAYTQVVILVRESDGCYRAKSDTIRLME